MGELGVRALTFDVFGTVVDWRGSVAEEARRIGQRRGIDIDGEALADAWRRLYQPSMERVRSGDRPFLKLDVLHRESLERVLVELGATALTEADREELTLAWHRLRPWPDAVEGLTRLRQRYVLTTLSNGNLSLLVDLAKHGSLPFDCILSAELMRVYKPDPRIYLGAADLLSLEPSKVMMVAAHQGDLRAARAQGLRTAFVVRPLEWGPDSRHDLTPDSDFDLVARDFLDLADQLGC